MKAAFTVWNERISPLLDAAREIHVVESMDGRIIGQSRETLSSDVPALKARQLSDMGVTTLVCGAVSRSMESILAGYGIHLVPFIRGDLAAVIAAWRQNGLHGDGFSMPGRKRHGADWLRRLHTANKREVIMNGNRSKGQGQGRSGQGRRGPGGGQCRNARAAGKTGAGAAVDQCVCPQCGHQSPHQRGVPCMQMTCDKCGATMLRQ